MPFLSVIWAFARSPAGRYAGIALALAAALFAQRQCGYSAGVAHERAASRRAVAAIQARLDTCTANAGALQAAVTAQNAQVAAWAADSDRRLRAASLALRGAEKGRGSVEARYARLMQAWPVGVDACARVFSADEAVLGALK
ncbi:hypothetical protein [Phenylobacterium sp.]|jgi:hypothetical protein|uniref:hypothetical protein n=1 Tax=Phenylobacterium sp. TaxID=1871053 RepID=UPI002F42A962